MCGILVVVMVRMMFCLCSDLKCLRLCSSVVGVRLGVEVRNIVVFDIVVMDFDFVICVSSVFSGSLVLWFLIVMMVLLCIQLVMMISMMVVMFSGIQLLLVIFIRFVFRKVRFSSRNGSIIVIDSYSGSFQCLCVMIIVSVVVMIIVLVMLMLQVVVRFEDDLKVIISVSMVIISQWLMLGRQIWL